MGRTVRANGVVRTIIGVMPERFAFPFREQAWLPLATDPLATKRGDGPGYLLVGRLKPGVRVAEAEATEPADATATPGESSDAASAAPLDALWIVGGVLLAAVAAIATWLVVRRRA